MGYRAVGAGLLGSAYAALAVHLAAVHRRPVGKAEDLHTLDVTGGPPHPGA